MYSEHNPRIAAHMRESLAGFKRGLFFVVASIRQPITVVPDQLPLIEKHGTSAGCLFGHKVAAVAYIDEHAATLWERVKACEGAREAIEILCEVPGLGIVKAGFAAQLMGFDVACLDSRNIKREGRDARAYRSDGIDVRTSPAYRKRIAAYVAETGGRAQEYWDAWCCDVARVYRKTPHEISALHLAILQPAQYDLSETF